jgi:hypothetical protein
VYRIDGAFPVDEEAAKVMVSCKGPGPPTVALGVVNVQSGIVNWSVYLNVDAMSSPRTA